MPSDEEPDEFWAPDESDTNAPYSKLRTGAIENDANLIREAASSGININALFPDEEDGVAALHEAASRGNSEALQALLDNGALVDVRAPEVGNQFEDRTPLYCAAEKGHAQAVRILLQAGADVKALGPHDDTAFGAVLRPLVQKARLGGGVEVEQRHIDTIGEFIQFGVDASERENFNGTTLVEQAAVLGNHKLFQDLLDQNISLEGAMTAAAKSASGLETIKYLLSIGIQDEDGQALADSALNNHVEIVRCLLSQQSHETTARNGALAMLCAAGGGHTDVVQLLLEHGISANASPSSGSTPLFAACASSKPIPAMLRLLLDNGADVNATVTQLAPRDALSHGDTPLHAAARWSFPSHISILLKAGTNPSTRNHEESSPLHSIARNFNNGWPMIPGGEDPRLEALRLMVRGGSDVNALDGAGNTPLKLLASNYRPSRRDSVVHAARILRSYGATGYEEMAAQFEGQDSELAAELRVMTLDSGDSQGKPKSTQG